MKNSFTTFDIVKILNIPRNLLAQWQSRGFIKPSIRKAQGAGTKNLFSLNDLYQIRLFHQLADSGMDRACARQYANVNFESVGPKVQCGVFRRKSEKPGGKAIIIGDMALVKEPATVEFDDDDSYAVVINLLGIKNWVNNRIDH